MYLNMRSELSPAPSDRATCGARLKCDPAKRCRHRPVPGRKRCFLHGGRSTGPKTKAGLERGLIAAYNGKRKWFEKRRQEGLPLPGRPKGSKNLATRAYEQAVAEYPRVLADHEQARREAAQAAYEAFLEKVRGERIPYGLKPAGARIKRDDAYRDYPPPPAPPRLEDFKARYRRRPKTPAFRPSLAVKTAPPVELPAPSGAIDPAGRPEGHGWTFDRGTGCWCRDCSPGPRQATVIDKGLDWLQGGDGPSRQSARPVRNWPYGRRYP